MHRASFCLATAVLLAPAGPGAAADPTAPQPNRPDQKVDLLGEWLLAGNPDADRYLGLFRQELDKGLWVYPARYDKPLPTAPR